MIGGGVTFFKRCKDWKLSDIGDRCGEGRGIGRYEEGEVDIVDNRMRESTV
jgi:hypothetical protein